MPFKIIEPLKMVMNKEETLNVGRLDQIIQSFSNCYRLTQRESEILALLATNGFTNREISERCDISEKTVKIHLSNIMKKVGISSMRKLLSVLFYHILVVEQSKKRNQRAENSANDKKP